MAKQLTEAQWLASNELLRLLMHLRRAHNVARSAAGRRKLRLFACACCRSLVWELDVAPGFRRVVEAAEQFADGHIDRAELDLFCAAAGQIPQPTWGNLWYAATAMLATTDPAPVEAARGAAADSLRARLPNPRQAGLNPGAPRGGEAEQRALKRLQCELLREIFGNPFRPVSVEPAWLAWNRGMLREIARAIYEERAFDRLPVFADALEEAGCAAADLLAHCRGPGPHVRGCWVVDLVLGKE